MVRHSRQIQLLAACLSMVAGYVDALGFLALGGFFVSFMSGNSTRLGVGIAQRSFNAVFAISLLAAFVGGVVAGSLIGHFAGHRRRQVVLMFVALMLAAAAVVSGARTSFVAACAMTAAMGAENAVFERDGEVTIGLTYMTGTLVKLGQRVGAALLGGDRFGWAPYALLWAGLVAGVVVGAQIYPLFGLRGLWGASLIVAVLSLVAGKLGPG